jgi:hypothetical protein
MKIALGRCLIALLVGTAVTAVTCSYGWAQLLPSAPGGVGGIGGGRPSQGPAGGPEKPSEKAPAAIPGAKAREPVVPASKNAGDMQPTDALFDAINRGDIAAARDALNRGADLNGINVLGMTPMELSVDLGRNDITFLLLSERGEDSGRGSRAVAHGTPDSERANKVVQAKKPAVPAKTKLAADAKPPAAKPAATPKLFANDGGTPLPSAGFLGFGSRQAAN